MNRPLFKPDTESVLVRGLNAMTAACDALTVQNENLNKEVAKLMLEVSMLNEKIILNGDEKE